jgi:hypothetical protein
VQIKEWRNADFHNAATGEINFEYVANISFMCQSWKPRHRPWCSMFGVFAQGAPPRNRGNRQRIHSKFWAVFQAYPKNGRSADFGERIRDRAVILLMSLTCAQGKGQM